MRTRSLWTRFGALSIVAGLALPPRSPAQSAYGRPTATDHPAPSAWGRFIGADGHEAVGRLGIVTADGTTWLTLERDFRVDRGPDVYVVLSASPAPLGEGALYLGKLKQLSGAQAYDIPDGTELSAYRYVVLWCERYSVAMGRAELFGGPRN